MVKWYSYPLEWRDHRTDHVTLPYTNRIRVGGRIISHTHTHTHTQRERFRWGLAGVDWRGWMFIFTHVDRLFRFTSVWLIVCWMIVPRFNFPPLCFREPHKDVLSQRCQQLSSTDLANSFSTYKI